jgi:hypothetical protein
MELIDAGLKVPQRGSHLQGIHREPMDLFQILESGLHVLIIPGCIHTYL